MTGCACLRVEDLGPLRDFIGKLGNLELHIKTDEIRKRAEIEDIVDLPPDEKQVRLLNVEIEMKNILRNAKIEEYKQLIEGYPQLCEIASGYL